MYVEDEVDARELVPMLYEHHGFGIVTAETAAGGLEALAGSAPFSLILVDYNLPDGTGTEMLRVAQARHLLEGARVFLVTAQTYPIRDPGVGLLVKPVPIAELLAIASAATGREATT